MIGRSISLVALSSLLTASNPLSTAPVACSMSPGAVMALLRVERDTTLPYVSFRRETMPSSSNSPGKADTLYAVPGTPMPSARVRLLDLDATTRAELAAQGITERQPTAYLKSAPYGADCRTMVYRSKEPFTVNGEVGYVRGILAPREHWVNGAPLLVIPDDFLYPYPRRRALVFRARPDAAVASAVDMFSFESTLDMPDGRNAGEQEAAQDVKRARATEWALANPKASDLEPIRQLLRSAILEADWREAAKVTSRVRGTYRIQITDGNDRATWFFRTHDRPSYSARFDSAMSTAQLLASPHIEGYTLVGRPAAMIDSLPVSDSFRGRVPLLWLRVADRPTVPGNESRRTLRAELEFMLSGTPERFWDDFDSLVPAMNPADSAFMMRLNPNRTRGDRQAKLPITVRIDDNGRVRADTSWVRGSRTLRISLERVDTTSIKRGWNN